MALTIKGNPILYGEDAKVFVEEAERKGFVWHFGRNRAEKPDIVF